VMGPFVECETFYRFVSHFVSHFVSRFVLFLVSFLVSHFSFLISRLSSGADVLAGSG
jgi:hypothetical protein